MKRFLTILALFAVLCCTFCNKQKDFIPAPIEQTIATEDSNLIIEQMRLEKELFSQIYYANIQLAKQGRIVVKKADSSKIQAIRASDPVNQ